MLIKGGSHKDYVFHTDIGYFGNLITPVFGSKLSKSRIPILTLGGVVMLKFKKRYSSQKVDIRLPEDVVLIPMDAILIEQVIVNLLENAVQHAKGMTRIVLSVFTIGKSAVFEIKDNGCGINPKRLETLFTGYYNDQNEIADSQKKNAGIGLSVCATIIRAHGGNIKAENLKTGGAVFRFNLDTEEIEDDTE
jgi:two-component system sensor histidine kinase KdpD